MTNKLFFIIAALVLCGQAMAREPYLNGGHFSALNNEWGQEEPVMAQSQEAMTLADIAASKCDTLDESKPESRPE